MEVKKNTITLSRNTGITLSASLVISMFALIYGIGSTVTALQASTAQNQTQITALSDKYDSIQTTDTQILSGLTAVQANVKDMRADLSQIKDRLYK